MRALVAAETRRTVVPALDALVGVLRARFGSHLAAILFYGACLRSGNMQDGLVDAYALVDDYQGAYRQRWLRLANRWLAPNVFYAECPAAEGRLRVKYAVLSLAHLERGVERWFHPYLWGRFSQPLRVAWVRGGSVRERLEICLASAVRRFARETLGCLDAPFTAAELWQHGLTRSYDAELRPETTGRAATLVSIQAEAYAARTAALTGGPHALLQAVGAGLYRARPGVAPAPGTCRRRWRLRRWQGRILSLARLAKAASTFDGGVDYAAWKVERHTGAAVPVTDALRRHPLVFGLLVVWRLSRRRLLR